MNLEELRSVQHTERQKDSLQALRPSFYQDVGEYIAELEGERDRLADDADDPFASPEVARLTDEIETAKDVVEAIYERRMGKLVKQASLAAAGMNADDEGLTAEERVLFEDLVERIRENKAEILDVLSGRTEGATVDRAGAADRSADVVPDDRPRPEGVGERGDRPVPPEDAPSGGAVGGPDGAHASGADEADGVSAADVMGGDPAPSDGSFDGGTESSGGADEPGDGSRGSAADERGTADSGSDESGADPDPDGGPSDARSDGDPAETGSDGTPVDADAGDRTAEADDASSVDRVTVQITADVGAILGVDDREYTLECDDVVTLPEENASPLIERDAAEPLE
ncbi:hypothetical protein [Halovivax sp.]|uniref:hypothetical protein n=1 Tax=Halovivax sp. TaxID=1935978 RepID=UPI0025BBA726|nr:hypothetical protein [Halovivax sp.]